MKSGNLEYGLISAEIAQPTQSQRHIDAVIFGDRLWPSDCFPQGSPGFQACGHRQTAA